MISHELGKVTKIVSEDESTSWIELDCSNKIKKAINYKEISGDVRVGDEVVINTTAVNLSLGTGGQHFVIYNYRNTKADLSGGGHIMKLRYTPIQMKVLAAEEEASEYHDLVKNFKSLDNHPVIIGTLHSMLAPIVARLKYGREDLKINYIMTDAGALPISFSNTVKDLKAKGLIDNTITVGHAFGADYECVNIYTGLIVSKEALNADITIITMGPGIVGTGTKYGFSGVEQGVNLDAVNSLGGYPIAVPRVGFKDERIRHQGISHQTITSLCDIAKTKGNIVFSNLKIKRDIIEKQIRENELDRKHNIYYEDGKDIREALEKYSLNTTTMGRGIDADPEFFYTLGAVAKYALGCIKEEENNVI